MVSPKLTTEFRPGERLPSALTKCLLQIRGWQFSGRFVRQITWTQHFGSVLFFRECARRDKWHTLLEVLEQSGTQQQWNILQRHTLINVLPPRPKFLFSCSIIMHKPYWCKSYSHFLLRFSTWMYYSCPARVKHSYMYMHTPCKCEGFLTTISVKHMVLIGVYPLNIIKVLGDGWEIGWSLWPRSSYSKELAIKGQQSSAILSHWSSGFAGGKKLLPS